jgi:catechol 2,3-dioxygenase-like lactoylglutathione lyase family enzyme
MTNNEASTPLVDVRCFSHVGITVSDIDAAVAFYTKILGCAPLFEDVEDGWARVGLAIGDIQLELFSPWPRATNTTQVINFFITDPDGTPIQLHRFNGGQQRVTELFQ